jgi:hypothetical protein
MHILGSGSVLSLKTRQLILGLDAKGNWEKKEGSRHKKTFLREKGQERISSNNISRK